MCCPGHHLAIIAPNSMKSCAKLIWLVAAVRDTMTCVSQPHSSASMTDKIRYPTKHTGYMRPPVFLCGSGSFFMKYIQHLENEANLPIEKVKVNRMV